MAKTIIEVDGKRYQVVRSENPKYPCRGCAFLKGKICCIYPTSPEYSPCIDYDNYELNIYHILKPIDNGTD